MTNRDQMLSQFIAEAGWADAQRETVAGDASNRRYERLTRRDTGQTVILMDAPPEKGEDIRPFVSIAQYLSGLGLSAPALFDRDAEKGVMLLEDLGDGLLARLVEQDPTTEIPLYEAATDTLVELHKSPPPQGLSPYSPQLMTEMAALAYDWYLLGVGQADPKAKDRFSDALQPLLEAHASQASVLIQRDYHSENLLWLPDRTGPARVGLLDFQDALAGHPAYDLVSLLQDARRAVPPSVEATMISRYLASTNENPEQFRQAYCLLGAQRNLRIVGVFARLCLRDAKPHYVDMIPRVWAHLQDDLRHPLLQPVAQIVNETLPTPTAEMCQKLKQGCATLCSP